MLSSPLPLIRISHRESATTTDKTASAALRSFGPSRSTAPFDEPSITHHRSLPHAAVLWDIRVSPPERGRGVGNLLFERALTWRRERGCRWLEIETQNVNVPACSFYAKHGCKLSIVDRHAYAASPHVAHEVMLVWMLELTASPT